MPAWVNEAYSEYHKRLSAEIKLQLIEIPPEIRTKNSDIERVKEKEGRKLLEAIPSHVKQVIALEVNGKPLTSEILAADLQGYMNHGESIALLVGGPDGLSDACRNRAHQQWSLSRLTLPHPLVRVLLAEQIYRAYSIIKKHPYHR